MRTFGLFALICLAACGGRVRDPGVNRPPTGDALCGERPGGREGDLEILRFQDPDASVIVQIERAYEAQGAGHSTIYRLDSWGMVAGGATTCIDDRASLEYENSHHNWRDTATATHDGVRYDLALSFEPGVEATWSMTLTTDGEDPVELIATGGPTMCWSCPGRVDVFISEIMADNRSALVKEDGTYESWIELFNPSASAVDLTGWFLSDDLSNRTKWTFPETTIGRHESLVLFASDAIMLSPGGSALVLSKPDGTTNGGFVYGPQSPDVSYGYTFSTATYHAMDMPTPGAQNPD